MFKRISLIAAVAALTLASGYANQTRDKVTISVDRVDPANGKQMYSNYCAPCHGVDGRGNGPVAGALTTQPGDLTALAKSHGGKYPGSHVVAVLQFGSDTRAHGSAQMPVWGPVLGKMNPTQTQQAAQRITNLSRYLESIQAK